MELEYDFNKENYRETSNTLYNHHFVCNSLVRLHLFFKTLICSIFIEWVVCARHCVIHPKDEIYGTQSQEVQRLVRKATCKCMDFIREQQGL